MKRTVLLLFVFIFLFPLLLNAQDVPLSLDQAVSLAIRENRSYLFQVEEVKKAKEKIKEARSGLLPSFTFTGSWEDTRGFFPKDTASVSTQASLRQYLYTGGQTINTIKLAESGLEVVQAVLDRAKLEIVFSVKSAFYTLALAEGLLELNAGILENSKEHQKLIKERYKNGEASESELLRIEASVASVQKGYEESLNQFQSAQALLNNILYLDKDVRIIAEGQFFYDKKEAAFDEAFLKAMRARPEIKQFDAQARSDKSSIQIAKAETRPKIYASWDYFSQSTTSLTFSPGKGWQDYQVIGLNFYWPIFDGWAAKHKVEQAIINLKQTQLLKERAIADIALELKNAYLSLKDALSGIDATDSDLMAYSDNLEAAKEKYRQGLISLLDLNDARLKYEVSRFNQKQALYDYIVSKAKFDKAQGG